MINDNGEWKEERGKDLEERGERREERDMICPLNIPLSYFLRIHLRFYLRFDLNFLHFISSRVLSFHFPLSSFL